MVRRSAAGGRPGGSLGRSSLFDVGVYLEHGGAMGWTPDQVLACGVGQFGAAFRGWLRAQGVDPDNPPPKPFGRADLERLKEKVGHGV